MSKVPQKEVERDQNLIADYQAKNNDGSWKYSTTELSAIYIISGTRIYQILNYYKIPRRSVRVEKGSHDRRAANTKNSSKK